MRSGRNRGPRATEVEPLETSDVSGLARTWTVIRLLVVGRRWRVAALVASSVTAGLLESTILFLVAQAAAAMVDGDSHVVADVGLFRARGSVGVVLAIAFALAVARLLLQVVVAYLPARIGADVQADLRNRLLDGFLCATWSRQAEDRDGDLQELLTNQNLLASQGVLQAGALVTSLLAFVVMLGTAAVLSLPVALVVVGAAGLVVFVLKPLTRLGRREAHGLSSASLAYADRVSETVLFAEETHVFGTAQVQRDQIRAEADEVRRALFMTWFVGRLAAYLYQGVAVLLIVGGLAGLYWWGTGRIAILGAVILILVRSAAYGQMAYGSYHLVQQAAPFLDRLLAAEERYRSAVLPMSGQPLENIRSVRCESVSFAYPRGAAALVDVSFDVLAGETVGIVGPSGAGKSTLVQVLLRLREPSRGRYLVNGEPAREVSPTEWHRRVAYVPQDPKLLHGTVAENIRFFREMDDSAIERAARLAYIHDEVARWSAGYDTVIGQRADAVSGGQRQRICLARALAAEPELLVLDEPTSALDLRSEALIHESLVSLRGRLTLFVVSHRLSTLSFCDRVIVMADGRVEAFGPTAQLGSNAFYQGAIALTARTGT